MTCTWQERGAEGLTAERIAAVLFVVDTLTLGGEPRMELRVIVRDPQGVPMLGMALAGAATHRVTGEEDRYVLAGDPACGNLPMVAPRIFIARLSGGAGEEGERDASQRPIGTRQEEGRVLHWSTGHCNRVGSL